MSDRSVETKSTIQLPNRIEEAAGSGVFAAKQQEDAAANPTAATIGNTLISLAARAPALSF